MEKIAVYPGSFDPITLGHLDIIKRSRKVVDKLVIGVMNNNSKSPLFSVDERVNMIKVVVKDIEGVEVKSFSGLTVDFARQEGAQFIVRGLRSITDFEYELEMAHVNHKLCPDLDTLFFTTSLQYTYLSSTTVKELARYGSNEVSQMVPCNVNKMLEEKLRRSGVCYYEQQN